MKYVWLCIALLASTLAVAQTPPFAALNPDIVRVQVHRDHPLHEDGVDEAADDTGTGLILQSGEDGVRILTALHVVHHTSRIQVFFFNDRVAPVEATLLPASNTSLDLAVLQAHPPRTVLGPHGLPPLTWLPLSDLTPSLHVWTVNGLWEPAPNNIIRLDSDGDVRKFAYTSTALGSGYSGAPVFDDAGRLVGIHLAAVPHSDYQLSEAVKISRALETLLALGYTNLNNVRLANGTAPSPPSAAPSPTLTPTASAAAKPQLWRCINNNGMYAVRLDANRLYIAQTNGVIVADLAQRDKDKHYVGRSTLSNCPNGGFMDLATVSNNRIDGKMEMKPANANCGGVGGLSFTFGRTMIPIAFLPGQ